MSRIRFTALTLVFLMFFATSIILPDFDVNVVEITSDVKPGTAAEFIIEFENKEDEAIFAQPFISGANPSWIQSYDYYVEVPADSKVSLPVRIVPLQDSPSGTYGFMVSTKVKIGNEWHSVLPEKFSVYVNRPTPEVILPETKMEISTNEDTYTPGESIQVSVRVSDLQETYKELNVELTFMDTKKNPIYNSLKVVPSRVEPIYVSDQISIDRRTPPGDYILVANLKTEKGTVASERAAISIRKIDDVEIKRSTRTGLLEKIKILTVINKGNTEASGEIKETIRWYEKWLTTSNPQPDYVKDNGQTIDLIWKFTNVEPGSETSGISFKISYLPVLLLFIVIVLLMVVGWQGSKSVSVRKNVTDQKIKDDVAEAKLTITIRNLTDHQIRNVVLTDFVPSLVSPSKFEIKTPSEKKTTKTGTHLEWDLGNLKPLEERVIHYHLKSKFGIVGTVDLPYSEIRFTDSQGKRQSEKSNTTEIGSSD
jgi:hypothetical protein